MEWEDNVEILDELEEEEPDLRISKLDANKNLEIAGTLVDEPEDHTSIAKNENLL